MELQSQPSDPLSSKQVVCLLVVTSATKFCWWPCTETQESAGLVHWANREIHLQLDALGYKNWLRLQNCYNQNYGSGKYTSKIIIIKKKKPKGVESRTASTAAAYSYIEIKHDLRLYLWPVANRAKHDAYPTVITVQTGTGCVWLSYIPIAHQLN